MTIVAREQVLTPVRVVSMLAEQLSKNAEQDDNQVQILDLEREVGIRPQITSHQGHRVGQCCGQSRWRLELKYICVHLRN